MDSDANQWPLLRINQYTTYWRLLLALCFLLSNTCWEPPTRHIEVPPDVTGANLEQIDRGFKISWTKLDSSEVDVIGYTIYRKDHDANSTSSYKEVEINVDSLLDVDSFNWPADSGKSYSYEIRSKHVDGIEGWPAKTQSRQLKSIPIDIAIFLEGSIKGIRNADPKDYTDTTRVWVKIQVKKGDPSELIISNDSLFTNAAWQPFKDEVEYHLIPTDGRKYVYMRAKNLGGGLSNKTPGSIILDTSPPHDLSISVVPVNNPLYQDYLTEVSDYTNDTKVQLELSASDLAKWRAALNNDSDDFPPNPPFTAWADEGANVVDTTWELVAQPGVRKVYARFEDNLSHVEENEIPFDGILYDTFDPVAQQCSVVINGGQRVISSPPYTDVTLTISAQDSGEAGIFLMRLGNSDSECRNAPWEYYADNKYWSLANLGAAEGYASRSVFVQFCDRAGNIGPTTPVSDNIWVNPPPGEIENFNAVGSYEKVSLSWDIAPENDVIAGGIYILERSQAGQSYNIIDTLDSDITQYIDTNVQNGTPYCYNIWAEDSTGLKGTKADTCATPNNQPPSIAGFIIAPDSVGRRETVFTFSATSDLVTDDHTPFADLKVQWKFKAGDAWSDATTKKDTTHTYANDTGNEYEVSLKVTDADGASFTTTRQVRINRPPNRPTLTATPQSEYKKKDITFTTDATDDDNDDLEYYFDFGDGTNSGWTPDSSLLHQFDPSGTYSAKVIVQDTWGDSSDWSLPLPVYITNQTPDAPQNPVASPSPVYKNTDIIVSATLSDPDVDNVRLQAQWEKGISEGTPVPSETSGSVTLTGGYNSSGPKTVTLYTLDEEDAASSPTPFDINVENRAPSAPTITGLPSTGYTCESVSCTVSATDPDGDDVQITVCWGDNTPCNTKSGPSASFSHVYYDTGPMSVTAYATDGENTDGPSSSDGISIQQRPPDINNPSSITITYPNSSGTTEVENVASSCAQTLIMSSISDNATWLTTSVNRTSLSPGQTATLTATVSSWSSFDNGETQYATITINSNDPDEPGKTVSVSATRPVPTGSLSVVVRNWNGNTVSGAEVIRYTTGWSYIDNAYTNSSGVASWSDIPSDYYNFEVYYNGEFWRSYSKYYVAPDQPNYLTLRREEPYALEVDDDGGVFLNKVRVHVYNDTDVIRTVRVTITVDDNRVSPYLYGPMTSAPVDISGNNNKWIVFDYNPPEPSDELYIKINSVETYVNGKYTMTDSWSWDFIPE